MTRYLLEVACLSAHIADGLALQISPCSNRLVRLSRRDFSLGIAASLTASLGLAACGSTTATFAHYPPRDVPIAVSAALSSPGQSPRILRPTICEMKQVFASNGSFAGIVLIARGNFISDSPLATYARSGDVIELYGYSMPSVRSWPPMQGALLRKEKPYPIKGNASKRWTVSVPLPRMPERIGRCLVAVQSTHARMGPGDVL